MTRPLYIERALFVVAYRNGGKSTHLRSMFADSRFHTSGVIPSPAETSKTVDLSNERHLFIKIMSLHETNRTLKNYFDKIEDKCKSGRWCFAGALRPSPENKIKENLGEIVEAFIARFEPERVRICFLSPDHNDELIDNAIMQLAAIEGIECVVIDASSDNAYRLTDNGLFLADFFDFT